MDIKILDKSLERYEGMVKAIAGEYESRLHNSTLFSWKLLVTSIIVIPSDAKLTSGLCEKEGTSIRILLQINDSNPDDYIAFVIAHEFAHLLFKKMTDVLCVTGRTSDRSTELTALTRISFDGKQYGKELEEQCADILALFIIKKLGYTHSKFLDEDLKKSLRKRIVVEKLANVFGNHLESAEFIDDFKMENGVGYVKNSFWYFVVTFSFTEIINFYDEVMGKKAWLRFCEALDNSDKKENLEFVENAIKRLQKSSKAA